MRKNPLNFRKKLGKLIKNNPLKKAIGEKKLKNSEVEKMELMIEEKEEKVQKARKERPQLITDLPGIGPSTAEKLSEAGFNDLMSIAVASPSELVAASELSDATAKKVIAIARKNIEMNFETGEDMLRRRQKVIKITTGSKELDGLFNGGVETGAVTEAYGQYGAGKSQLAHALAVRCQLPLESGGAGGMAVFIDTENTFRPERIVQISNGLGIDAEQTLKNIKVARAYNSEHQMLLAEKIEDLIKEQGQKVRVVIVDSLTAHFRAEFVGRGTLADRQQRINKHMHTLMRLADAHNVAIYVTNQVMAKPDVFFGDPTEAIGGHIVAHNSTYRVYLRRGKKGTRVAKMVDAPNIAEKEAVFMIHEDGIKDV